MLNFSFEENLFSQGYKIIGSLDEAGRGPLAGPVVAACVIFDSNISQNFNDKINDSKQLTSQQRDEAYQLIMENFGHVGIGICDHETIDRINIFQATFLAMKKALGQIKIKPDFVLVDGKFPIPNYSSKQQAIIKGDEKVLTIAAASIVAKVTRDRIMQEMHELYPEYGFDQHKGYGTRLHLERLKKLGLCPIHRKSFHVKNSC